MLDSCAAPGLAGAFGAIFVEPLISIAIVISVQMRWAASELRRPVSDAGPALRRTPPIPFIPKLLGSSPAPSLTATTLPTPWSSGEQLAEGALCCGHALRPPAPLHCRYALACKFRLRNANVHSVRWSDCCGQVLQMARQSEQTMTTITMELQPCTLPQALLT